MRLATGSKIIAIGLALALGLGACSGETKPEKAKLKATLAQQASENLTAKQKTVATQISNCFVDNVYDKLDAKALKELTKATGAKPSASEQKTISASLKLCKEKVHKELQTKRK